MVAVKKTPQVEDGNILMKSSIELEANKPSLIELYHFAGINGD